MANLKSIATKTALAAGILGITTTSVKSQNSGTIANAGDAQKKIETTYAKKNFAGKSILDIHTFKFTPFNGDTIVNDAVWLKTDCAMMSAESRGGAYLGTFLVNIVSDCDTLNMSWDGYHDFGKLFPKPGEKHIKKVIEWGDGPRGIRYYAIEYNCSGFKIPKTINFFVYRTKQERIDRKMNEEYAINLISLRSREILEKYPNIQINIINTISLEEMMTATTAKTIPTKEQIRQ